MAAPAEAPGFAARWAALKNLPPFMAMVWRASPGLTLAMILLRLVRAVLPVSMLWIGKLIIDEVVRLGALQTRPEGVSDWWQSGLADYLGLLIAAELGLALASDLIGRLVGYADSLLQERLVISLSVRLMDHAADLDLASFEDAGFQDRLDRARRQTMGRIPLVGQMMQQLQDGVTVASFGAGLIAYNPWLVILLAVALIPTLIGQLHFNAMLYQMNWRRAPERRERDYLRMIGATSESAKEVKIFGLNRFLRDRYRELAERFYAENRAINRRQLAVMAALTGIGTLFYYGAYLWIIARTLTGALSLGDLTFLSGSFLRLRGLIEGLLTSFSDMAGQALYLDDLYRFFDEVPAIASPADALPVPLPIRHGITFEDVGFRYPGAERWAVRHLSFHLRAGETVALVGENGKLLGIGSLLVNDAAIPNVSSLGNMFVPIDRLEPILADLLQNGRRAGPKRPWIGANTFETNGRIFVARVSKNGPADKAGVKAGDVIVELAGKKIEAVVAAKSVKAAQKMPVALSARFGPMDISHGQPEASSAGKKPL